MRFLILSLVTLILGFGSGIARAQTNDPVVVELFTSQGCSSCPPADAFLAELAKNPNVLPLAFHVDYWDRLGWKDTFGSQENTARQYAYSRQFNNRSVWTPQFVVEGQQYSKGNFRQMVAEYIAEALARPATVDLNVARGNGAELEISAKPLSRGLPDMEVLIVHFRDAARVKVQRGENAGRTLSYGHIVEQAYPVGRWNARREGRLEIALKGALPVAVIVQERGAGPIHASTVLR